MKVAVEMKDDSCVARPARRTCEPADADASVNGGEGRQPLPGWEGVRPAEVAFLEGNTRKDEDVEWMR